LTISCPDKSKDTTVLSVSHHFISKRLSEALTSSGVDNIDYYPARSINAHTKEVYDYVACRIIGLVSAMSGEDSDIEA